jgi:hypothetical protein
VDVYVKRLSLSFDPKQNSGYREILMQLLSAKFNENPFSRRKNKLRSYLEEKLAAPA